MIPFHTCLLIDGQFAEYRISYEEDVYRAELLAYDFANGYAPKEIIFWKKDARWESWFSADREAVALLGSLVDIYLFNAATFKAS